MKRYTRVIAKAMAVSLLLATSLTNLNGYSSIEAAPPDAPPEVNVKILVAAKSEDSLPKVMVIEKIGDEVNQKLLAVRGLPEGEKIILVDLYGDTPFGPTFLALSSENKVYLLINDLTDSFLHVQGEFDLPIPKHLVDNEPAFDRDPVNDLLNITDNLKRSNLVSMTGQMRDVTEPFTFESLDRNAGMTPNIKGLAYDNNVEGATRSFLYGVDTNTDSLVFVFSPLQGKMITKGGLGFDAMKAELDIFSMRMGEDVIINKAFALITIEGETLPGVYQIDLNTGQASKLFSINEPVQGFTVISVEEAPDTAAPQVENVAVAGGASKVKRGKTVSITWEATDNRAVARQFVELSTDNGQTFNPISDQLPGDARSFEWTVDENLSKSKKSFIRIRSLDGAGNEGEGMSRKIKIK